MLKTFPKGGVHPAENKISANKAIEILETPKKVMIPISQHIGAPAKVLVTAKDPVKVGQKIADIAGFISASIHSSVSGTVVKVDEVIDTSGYKRQAVFINVDGDEWDEGIDRSSDIIKEIKLTKEEIVKRVTESGVVGLGGATFPSHVKLSVPNGKSVDHIIINGVECEPYLTADHQLMLEKGEEIIIGISIMMKALDVKNAIVGIENNKKNAIEHLTKIAASYEGISIQGLEVKYPQGGEKQLVEALLGREVPPPPGLPIDVGCVVQNVGTVFAIYEAVQKNKPLIERVVTVTGKSVTNPGNYWVRIGSPVSGLIEKAGGVPENTGKIISGGPMMGKTLTSIDVPMVKGTSGVLMLPQAESRREKERACIRCAKCTFVCPMRLEPNLISALSKNSVYDKAEGEKIMDCIECGSCTFTCPASIPLLDYIRLGKNEVGKIIRARK